MAFSQTGIFGLGLVLVRGYELTRLSMDEKDGLGVFVLWWGFEGWIVVRGWMVFLGRICCRMDG